MDFRLESRLSSLRSFQRGIIAKGGRSKQMRLVRIEGSTLFIVSARSARVLKLSFIALLSLSCNF